MKNLPFFTTEYGIASLTLDQIPYTHAAYLTMQSTQQPEKLLEECVGFCKAVGAEHIYACNHAFLEKYPVYTDVVEMKAEKSLLPRSSFRLIPVTEETVEVFCKIYNEKMIDVKTAGYMTRSSLKTQNAYFVYEDDVLAGIGIVNNDTLSAVASLQKGAGRNVLCALCQTIANDVIRLEVASENRKAVSLYRSLGFQQSKVCNTWYKII